MAVIDGYKINDAAKDDDAHNDYYYDLLNYKKQVLFLQHAQCCKNKDNKFVLLFCFIGKY